MAGGRPTKYSREMVDKARAYITNYKEVHGHMIPSIVGMAVVLNVGKSTLYDWANDDEKEFSDILDECMSHQEVKLFNGGLSSEFNSSIVKLALGKHGYSDKVEQDTLHSFDLSGHSSDQLNAIIEGKDS
jgi:hypothetical protein